MSQRKTIVKLGKIAFIVQQQTIIQTNCADVIVKVAQSSSFFFNSHAKKRDISNTHDS